jgi:hypothetical protein
LERTTAEVSTVTEVSMPDRWDLELYRHRAHEWREKAASLPEGQERSECLVIAEGYERLIEVIETQRRGPQQRGDGGEPEPSDKDGEPP